MVLSLSPYPPALSPSNNFGSFLERGYRITPGTSEKFGVLDSRSGVEGAISDNFGGFGQSVSDNFGEKYRITSGKNRKKAVPDGRSFGPMMMSSFF